MIYSIMSLYVAVSVEEVNHNPEKEQLVVPKMRIFYGEKPENNPGIKWCTEVACTIILQQ